MCKVRSGSTLGIVWQDANTGTASSRNGFFDRITIVNATNSPDLAQHAARAYGRPPAGNIAGGRGASRYYAFTLPEGRVAPGFPDHDHRRQSEQSLRIVREPMQRPTTLVARRLLRYHLIRISSSPTSSFLLCCRRRPDFRFPGRIAIKEAACGVWFDQVFLTDTNSLGGGQILSSFAYTSGLTAGQSVTLTQTVTLPAFATSNQWIIVKANAAAAFWKRAAPATARDFHEPHRRGCNLATQRQPRDRLGGRWRSAVLVSPQVAMAI